MNAHEAAILSRLKTPLANKWMLAEITDAEATTSKSGRDQVVVQLAPVVNNYPNRELTLRGYVQKAMEGDMPDVLGKIRKRGTPFIRAVDPEFPQFPKREGQGVYVVTTPVTIRHGKFEGTTFEEGEQIGFEEYNAIKIEIDALALEALEELETRTDDLKGLRLYIRPGRASYSEEWGVSQFIDGYGMEPPAGREVVEGDDVVDREAQQRIMGELGVSLPEG